MRTRFFEESWGNGILEFFRNLVYKSLELWNYKQKNNEYLLIFCIFVIQWFKKFQSIESHLYDGHLSSESKNQEFKLRLLLSLDLATDNKFNYKRWENLKATLTLQKTGILSTNFNLFLWSKKRQINIEHRKNIFICQICSVALNTVSLFSI